MGQEENGVLAIDWWESAGCLELGPKAKELFDELDRSRGFAEVDRKPHRVAMGDGCFLVHSHGMGSGRAAHMGFRLEYCGAVVGLSPRIEASRLLPNFYLKISGEPSVIHGARELRSRILDSLAEFDLVLTDEWFRRLDISLDLPGWSWEKHFADPCEAKQYVGTGRNSTAHRDGHQTTGFSVRAGGVGLVIYDKRLETFAKKPEAYQRAMIQNRWSDNIPESATRIEYQIRREWFAERGLKTVESVLNNLGGIIAFLTKCEDRPFFFLTDRVPDRECRHQNRAQPHESWRRAVAIMQEQAGKPMQEIRRLDRSMMKSSRAIRVAIGHVQTAAAQLELNIGGCDDLVWVFSELLRRTGITDEEVSQQWEAKARRAGTYGRVTGFPFGGNQAI